MTAAERHGVFAGETERRVGFFLAPTFSMLAFVSAIEALRASNRLRERPLYGWEVVSVDGNPVEASNGMAQAADRSIRDAGPYDTVMVIGPFEPAPYWEPAVFAWLRRLARHGAKLGGLCTGAFVLARAGLMQGHQCTMHWEILPDFLEAFPEIEATTDLYQLEGKRFSAAGGTAGLDMTLALIAEEHGWDLAAEISDVFVLERVRAPTEPQRMALANRLGSIHPKLVKCVALMDSNVEVPLRPPELALAVGLSKRQLERLFRRHLGTTLGHYYMSIRLKTARRLVEQTNLRIAEIAFACGFSSPTYFSQLYRAAYGHSPRHDRRAIADEVARDVA